MPLVMQKAMKASVTKKKVSGHISDLASFFDAAAFQASITKTIHDHLLARNTSLPLTLLALDAFGYRY